MSGGETIESLLNPSLKVSRPVSACKKCRIAKIKCDGKLPACTACERQGKAQECSSANDDFARGKERSYVAALEIAAQKLQRKVNEHRIHNGALGHDPLTMMTHGRPSLRRKPISQTRRNEAGSVDELVSDLGFLTVNATSRDFQGFSSTMSFARMLKAIALKKDFPSYGEASLPSRQSILMLVDHYFDNVHVMLPFLSETEFQSALSRLYQSSDHKACAPFDIWCLRLVLAISSASLCQIRGDEHYENALYNVSVAMQLMDQVVYPGSIAGIQALLLLTQYSLVDPEHLDCWYLAGMSARLIVDLGLHTEPTAETKITKYALDQRRRVFYCTYAIDRLVSMSTGHAFTFTDDSAPNVLLPTLATDQEARSPSTLFTRSIRPSLFLFDIRRVQSTYYQFTHCSSRKEWTNESSQSYVASTLEDIRSWQATLSSAFSDTALQYFHLESLYTQALVLSPNEVILIAHLSDTQRASLFNVVVQYVDHFRHVLQRQELRHMLTYADFRRVRSLAKQFQNLMWAKFDAMIHGSGDIQSPSPLQNCDRALSLLSSVSQILEWPRQRWAIGDLKDSFERESAVLLARLQTKRQNYTAVQLPAPPQKPHMPQQQAQQSTQNFEYHQAFHSHHPSMDGSMSQLPYNYPQMPQAASYNVNTQPVSELGGRYVSPDRQASHPMEAGWSQNSGQGDNDLPHGSLPRRSYQFTGGQN